MLLTFQDQGADIFAEKIGEAVGAVVFVIILIMGMVWLVKKLRK